jgi:hypothetical protein
VSKPGLVNKHPVPVKPVKFLLFKEMVLFVIEKIQSKLLTLKKSINFLLCKLAVISGVRE